MLTRYRCLPLAHLDQATAVPVGRYERERPGELVHVDIKKLGRIPDGCGWRAIPQGTAPAELTHSTGSDVRFSATCSDIQDYRGAAGSMVMSPSSQAMLSLTPSPYSDGG